MAIALVLQTWFDIAIQYTGSAMNAYAIALANDRAITDGLIPGEQLIIPTDLFVYNKEVLFLESKNIIPATGITKDGFEVISPTLGIGTMAIGTTFTIG